MTNRMRQRMIENTNTRNVAMTASINGRKAHSRLRKICDMNTNTNKQQSYNHISNNDTNEMTMNSVKFNTS